MPSGNKRIRKKKPKHKEKRKSDSAYGLPLFFLCSQIYDETEPVPNGKKVRFTIAWCGGWDLNLPPVLRKKTDKISACPRSISLAPNRQHQTDSPRQYPGGDVIPLEGLAVQADGHRLGEAHLRLAYLAVGDEPGQLRVADV